MRAVFLDRDGVILDDSGYMHRPQDLKFAVGAIGALKRLHDAGFALVVVTNQSGIGRGYFSEDEYRAFNDLFVEELARQGVTLMGVYHCPHAPTADGVAECDCRKPKPGMLLRAIADHQIDAARSIMIGDRVSDIVAGRAAGVLETVLISSSNQTASDQSATGDTTAVAKDLAEATDRILSPS